MTDCESCKPSSIYDLIIIGGGAAGFSAATKASELGFSTLMVNGGLPIGGTCVNVGCVPSKILIEMSNNYYYGARSEYNAIGGTCNTKLDFAAAMDEVRQMVHHLRKSNYVEVAETFTNFTYVEGKAKFVTPTEIEVNGKRYTGKKFVIATGSRPRIIPFEGIDEVETLTSREIFSLDELPKHLVVIGGGAIGLEMAQAFTHFGSTVTVVERMPHILPNADPEIAHELQKALEKEGIRFILNASVKRLQKSETGEKIVQIEGREPIACSHILMAVGITPNTDTLDLQKAGVQTDHRGFVKINKFLQTTQPHIYAAGDVAGTMFLETIAAKEGYFAAHNALMGNQKWIDYLKVPLAVFTTPQVAMVGYTEKEYLKSHDDCYCRTLDLATIPKAQALKEQYGIIKMMVDPETDKVVGVSIVSNLAADLIHEATMTVKYGLTVDDIIDTVHVFPTMSEGLKRVAQAFRINVQKMSCCVV